MPHGQAMAPGLQSVLIPHGHHMPKAGPPRPPGLGRGKAQGPWGSVGLPAPCPTHLLPCKNTAGSRAMSLQATPALLHLCRRDKGAWGMSPRGSSWQGSGKRAVHPTVSPRDELGELGWSQFSECPFASSSIHLIWGLISLRHNHETVNTSLRLSNLLMNTEHDQQLPFPYK